MILFLACLLIGPFLLVCLVLVVIRDRAIRTEGALNESRRYGEQMRDIAARAIGLAQEAVKESEVPAKADMEFTWPAQSDKATFSYIAPITTNCPKCGVSVRHPPDLYPVRCPASDCGALIDAPGDSILDADHLI